MSNIEHWEHECPVHGSDALKTVGYPPEHHCDICGRKCENVKYVRAEQLRGAVSANDDAFQVICDALSALHPPQARELMESSAYKAFAAFYKRGQ